MKQIIAFAVLLLAVSAKLTGYNAFVNETTVQGLSSGAFMAVQLHFAFSENIKGAAVHAGGPYYCAQGSQITATTACMSIPLTLDVAKLEKAAQGFADDGKIDSLDNLKGSNVYLFSGTKDSLVNPGVVKKAEKMYTDFGCNVKTQYSIPAQHSYVTEDFGNSCGTLGSPYINNCDFNAAFESMSAIIPGIKQGTKQIAENLIEFDQTAYTSAGFSMGTKAYVYVPTACQNGEKCRVNIALHGCAQTLADVGDDFASKTGINEIAEANNIIVLYPQAKKSMITPSNPQGCWDWWGYSDSFLDKTKYVSKDGKQMNAIWEMVQDLCAGAKYVEEQQ